MHTPQIDRLLNEYKELKDLTGSISETNLLSTIIEDTFTDIDCKALIDELQSARDVLNTTETEVSDTPIVGWTAKSKHSKLEVEIKDGKPYSFNSFCGEVIVDSSVYPVGFYINSWDTYSFTFHKPKKK